MHGCQGCVSLSPIEVFEMVARGLCSSDGLTRFLVIWSLDLVAKSSPQRRLCLVKRTPGGKKLHPHSTVVSSPDARDASV